MQQCRRGIALFFSTVIVVSPTVARADEPEPGTRVRLTLRNGSSLIGRFVAGDQDHLSVREGDGDAVTAVERLGVTRVEESLGVRSKSRGAKRGAVAGALAATVITAVAFAACSDFCRGSDGVLLAMGLANAGIGAGLGAAIGAARAAEEKWQPVHFGSAQAALTVGPRGRVGLSVSILF